MGHKFFVWYILMMMVPLPIMAQSGAPRLIQFHSRLVDPLTGLPISSPTHIRVQLIQGGTAEDEIGGGRVVFSELALVTPDENGWFDYLIGSNAPPTGSNLVRLDLEDLNTTQPVFVEVALVEPTAGGNSSLTVLLPRQQLASTAYALQAEMARDAAVDDRLVNVDGDTMTGPLQINASLRVGSGGPSLGSGDAFVAGNLQVGTPLMRISGAGIRFPDGTLQTTAAGLSSVARNATLTGNGTSGSPLGVSVPLSLSGAAGEAIITGNHTSAASAASKALAPTETASKALAPTDSASLAAAPAASAWVAPAPAISAFLA